jgi:transposase
VCRDRVADLDKEIARHAREDEVPRRLMIIPGIGPISATAIAALVWTTDSMKLLMQPVICLWIPRL